jgi:hypothetical protein
MMLSSTDPLALFPFDGGYFGEEAFSRSQSPLSDSQSDSHLPFGSYGSRHSLPDAAERLQDPYLSCDRDLGWNIDWAVAFIVDRLDQSWEDATTSLRNIHLRAAVLHEKGLSHEIPFRIFNKLDQVLFAGHLRNAVFLDIDSLNPDVSGATYTHRWGPRPEVQRISIILNRVVIRHGQAKDVVATLIHQMIHAYFLVACGEQKENEVDYGRLGHSVHFGKIMLAIKRLSAHGAELTSLDYGRRSPNRHCYADGYSSWRRHQIEHEDRDEWYCSHCYSDVCGPSDSEVDTWYKKVCQPMFYQPQSVRGLEVQVYNDRRHELETVRRARLASSVKSVEFILKKKPVLVDIDAIKQFPSVVKAFDRASSRFLDVPKEVSEGTFMRLLEFLHTGSYLPDPHLFAAAAAIPDIGIQRKRPPIITVRNTSTGVAVVLADVQFAKLGALMGFEECKSYALDRMNTYGVLYEDPVTVLREIYRGSEPECDLKAWALKFLLRCPTTSSLGYYYRNSLDHSTIEPPNLLKLESQQSPYRSRFLDAIEASDALENDVNKARAELKDAGWYTSAGYLADQPMSYLNSHRSPFQPTVLLGPSLSAFSPSSSSSSSSWYSVHNLSSHFFSLQIDRPRDTERDKARDRHPIGKNRNNGARYRTRERETARERYRF